MAAVPVVTAARHNPALSSLVTAVTRANLTDSLDAQQGITVLAPANPAFATVPKKTLGELGRLLGDAGCLRPNAGPSASPPSTKKSGPGSPPPPSQYSS